MATPFSRFHALMSLVAASVAQGMGFNAALLNAGPYVSRGKGSGSHGGSSNGGRTGANGAFKRGATKARNQAKHRKACR